MTTICPNCGAKISTKEEICPNCQFNIKKYREEFFTDQHQKAKFEGADEGAKIASRAAYRKEFFPDKENTTIQKMIAWVHKNATIVFLLGIFLLLIMSFSRPLAWIIFLGLMVWLIVVCDKAEKIEAYTVEIRLTEELNKLGSNLFNSVENQSHKIKHRSQKFEKKHPKVESRVSEVKASRHFTYIQLSVVLTAFISLLVLFTGSGAAVSSALYPQKMSISRVLLSFASRLLASGQTTAYALIMYLIWLLLIAFPVVIIYQTFKNTRKSQIFAFILSLIETLFLIYVVFRMSSAARANTGIFSRLTSQLMTYAISVGTSTYFLILASIMTTCLSCYSLFTKKFSKDASEIEE